MMIVSSDGIKIYEDGDKYDVVRVLYDLNKNIKILAEKLDRLEERNEKEKAQKDG